MNDIETILSDLADGLSSSGLKLYLKVSDGAVTSRRLWLSLNPDNNDSQVSVENSPTIPRMLEEQVVKHAGRFGGFIGIAKNGEVTFAASYHHHSPPKVPRFGN